MATFTMATDDSSGPTAKELLELRAVALLPIERKTYDTKLGERLGVRFRAFDLSGAQPDDLGTGVFFQEVLVEKLSKMMHEWTVGRITQPNKAYLLKPPAPEDHERVAALMELVPAPADILAGNDDELTAADDGELVPARVTPPPHLDDF